MKKSFAFLAFAAALAALPLLSSSTAHAGIAACGDINVEANGVCTAEVQGGCTVNCTPIHFEAACSVEVETTCNGMCTGNPLPSCTVDCSGSCVAECMAQPAMFDCSASCNANADSQCSAECSSAANSTQCTARCKAHFSAQCEASCTGKPASATCDAKCQGSCQGSCTAASTLKCRVGCESTGYGECDTRLQGKCTTACSDPNGALFCDGNYIDHGGNAQACIDAIRAALPTVTIDTSATAQGSCTGSKCQASGEAQATAKCSFSPRSAAGVNGYGAFAALVALGAACLRRRRAR